MGITTTNQVLSYTGVLNPQRRKKQGQLDEAWDKP